jgi:tetratricopeptide (TPR) repeat protein
MDEPSVTLYGYQTEREQIEAAIAEKETLCFVCLDGPGGIGKTTMLRAVYDKYRKDKAYRITELLDFDDLRLHILQNILHEFATQLRTSKAPFTNYFEAAAHLREMQHRGASRLHIEDQEKCTWEAFINDYRTLSAQQRSILLFDTVEKVQDFALWQDLVGLLLELENTIVLLAGRRNREVGKGLQDLLTPPNRVQVIPLRGLSKKESLDYFERTRLGEFLAAEDPEQSRVVCQLSAGRPILIDLAVDWLGQGLKLAIPDQPLDRLDEVSLRERERQFEQGLVEQVKDLGEPRNEAILEMAHVYHYFDAERYHYLHEDVSIEEAQALLDKLGAFSFVKSQPGGGVRLHDEMQRMVSHYVWPALDRSGKRRRWLSDHMVQFYEERLAECEDDPALWQALVAEQLYHRLYADIQQGHRSFRPIFRQALAQYQLGFAHVLLNTLDQFSPNFDQELQAWSKVHKGRLLRAEEKVEEAVELIRPAKGKLQELGVREELDTVCNALGYCYRLLGNWDQAIAAYKEALIYSREEKDARQIAETMNNIANTCRLIGDFEQANRYSLVSLKIRERLGDKGAIGNSCYVRGMISWETGNTAEAAGYGRRARQLFSETDDLQGIAEIDRFESYLHFRTGDLEGALPLIKKAQIVFDEKGIGLGLADALNLEARILIDKHAAEGEKDEGFQEVEALAKRALSVARRIQDHYKLAECHLTLCRLYYRWGRYWQRQGSKRRVQKYQRLARAQYDAPGGGQSARERNYFTVWSVYEWSMGDLAFEAGDWKTAFDHYLQECATAARYKDARFARALNGLSDRMHRLPAADDGSRELTRQYCDYVIAEWKAWGLDKDYPEVVEECEYIKQFLRLADPQYLDQLRQYGADLLARGDWERAVTVYQELLTTGQTYDPDEQAADAMNQSAWAYRQMGRFTQARRLCQQSLLIRQQLEVHQDVKTPGPIASSRMVMGAIMWTTGNTGEAARYLRLARELYREARDEVGLARADRHTAFLHFRIGDHEKAQHYLNRAEETFREKGLHADLADALNLRARILRATSRHDEALAYAEESRCLAEENGAHYTLAEAWLTLGLMEHDGGRRAQREGKTEEAQHHFERAKALYRNGYPIAERYGYNLLLSVYESTAGGIAFEEGRYADAFGHFVRDLEFGSRYERGRMRRELDRIVDYLVQLPDELRRFYADYMIMEWQDRGLAEAEPDVPRLFQLLKEYREYVQLHTE